MTRPGTHRWSTDVASRGGVRVWAVRVWVLHRACALLCVCALLWGGSGCAPRPRAAPSPPASPPPRPWAVIPPPVVVAQPAPPPAPPGRGAAVGQGSAPAPGPAMHGGDHARDTPAAALPIHQRGVASYYADSLTGRPTASGEPYDPSRLTAAHRELPFGSVVDVVRDDGRWVRVRINDRGPFTAGRVVDLSRRAAEHVGLVGPGIAPVRLYLVWQPE